VEGFSVDIWVEGIGQMLLCIFDMENPPRPNRHTCLTSLDARIPCHFVSRTEVKTEKGAAANDVLFMHQLSKNVDRCYREGNAGSEDCSVLNQNIPCFSGNFYSKLMNIARNSEFCS
jgi:hypothetical protein